MRLWLVRHAKSSWEDSRQSDFDRPLNDRGRRDGPRMQAWLSSEAHPPTWIISSDAVRARATAEFVHAAFPDATLTTDHRLYGASAETIVDVVKEVPTGVTTVAIVAHNPGISDCLNFLCGKHAASLPTFGVARLYWPDELVVGRAALETSMVPKQLPD